MVLPTQTKKKIFLVEDNAFYQFLIRYHLERKGYEVTVFESGEDALEMMHQAPDLILLDHNLAGLLSGTDVLKMMKKITDPIPVIVLTAQENINVAVEVFKSGAVDYINKNDLVVSELVDNVHKQIHMYEDQKKALSKQKMERLSLIFASIMLSIVSLSLIVISLF